MSHEQTERDPSAKDVWSVGEETRHVVAVTPASVVYHAKIYGKWERVMARVDIGDWRKWAATAEVTSKVEVL